MACDHRCLFTRPDVRFVNHLLSLPPKTTCSMPCFAVVNLPTAAHRTLNSRRSCRSLIAVHMNIAVLCQVLDTCDASVVLGCLKDHAGKFKIRRACRCFLQSLPQILYQSLLHCLGRRNHAPPFFKKPKGPCAPFYMAISRLLHIGNG